MVHRKRLRASGVHFRRVLVIATGLLVSRPAMARSEMTKLCFPLDRIPSSVQSHTPCLHQHCQMIK